MMISNNQKHGVRSIMMMLIITVGLLALNPSMLAQEIGAQETMTTTLTLSIDIDCEHKSFSHDTFEACSELRFLPPFPIVIDSDSGLDEVIAVEPTDVTLGAGDYRIDNSAIQFEAEDLLDHIEERYPDIIITGPIDHYVGDCTRQGDLVATGFIQEGQHQTCHITNVFDIRDMYQ